MPVRLTRSVGAAWNVTKSASAGAAKFRSAVLASVPDNPTPSPDPPSNEPVIPAPEIDTAPDDRLTRPLIGVATAGLATAATTRQAPTNTRARGEERRIGFTCSVKVRRPVVEEEGEPSMQTAPDREQAHCQGPAPVRIARFCRLLGPAGGPSGAGQTLVGTRGAPRRSSAGPAPGLRGYGRRSTVDGQRSTVNCRRSTVYRLP